MSFFSKRESESQTRISIYPGGEKSHNFSFSYAKTTKIVVARYINNEMVAYRNSNKINRPNLSSTSKLKDFVPWLRSSEFIVSLKIIE